MSLIKANAVQVGQSPTATQNFTLAVPSSPDGTIKLARGNAGATTQDVLSVDASGNINGLVKTTGSTTARSLANRFADVVNVKDFGAVGDGVSRPLSTIYATLSAAQSVYPFVTSLSQELDWAAIQAAINAFNYGTVVFPKGNYLINSNITLLQKGGDSINQRFEIQATGAKFTGTGSIIIDSCKRLELTGFEMPTQNIIMRGCWWSQFNNLMFKQLIFNDVAGTNFSSSYWIQFNNCLLQNITKQSATLEPINEITFYSCGLRGNANHGFTTTFNYAFEFNGNTNAQAWKFFGGDISYHNTAIYYINPANTSDVELSFNGVYFDTLLPEPTSLNKAIIETHYCHNAFGVGAYRSLRGSVSAVTATITNLTGARTFRYNGATHFNLVPGGDFINDLGTWVGANKPLSSVSGATVTSQSGGLTGTYININQPNTVGNLVYFRRTATSFTSKLVGTLVLRNANAGSKTIQVGMFGLFAPITISDTEWTAVSITSDFEIAASANSGDIVISTTDSTAFNIDVAYAGIHYGIVAPFFSQSSGFKTIEFSDAAYNPASIPANSTLVDTFTMTGAEVGDFVLASTTTADPLINDVVLRPSVSATNTVSLIIYNPTANPINLPILGLSLRVWKKNLYQ